MLFNQNIIIFSSIHKNNLPLEQCEKPCNFTLNGFFYRVFQIFLYNYEKQHKNINNYVHLLINEQEISVKEEKKEMKPTHARTHILNKYRVF